MKHATTNHFVEKGDYGMAMKTAAFLAAIKRGAHFIFHSNPGKTRLFDFYALLWFLQIYSHKAVDLSISIHEQ